MLQLRLRCMQTQKHGNAESEMQDAHGHNPKYESSRKVSLAVADGASESAYSEQWAELLVKDYVGKPYVESRTLQRRASRLAKEWHKNVSRPGLPWYTEEKIRRGAFSTFLGVTIKKHTGAWKAIAIGDTCLFQVRDETLLHSWPLDDPTKFGRSPFLLPTNDASSAPVEESIVKTSGIVGSGDLLILASDALSIWFLDQYEQGRRPWTTLIEIEQPQFGQWINEIRKSHQIHNDDVTCVFCVIEEA